MTKQTTNNRRNRPNFQNDLNITSGPQVTVSLYMDSGTINAFLEALQEFNNQMDAKNQPARHISRACAALEGVLWAWAGVVHQGNFNVL
jgi:hypothetical protein